MTSAGDSVQIRVGVVTDYRPRISNNISSEKLLKVNLRDSGIDF